MSMALQGNRSFSVDAQAQENDEYGSKYDDDGHIKRTGIYLSILFPTIH